MATPWETRRSISNMVISIIFMSANKLFTRKTHRVSTETLRATSHSSGRPTLMYVPVNEDSLYLVKILPWRSVGKCYNSAELLKAFTNTTTAFMESLMVSYFYRSLWGHVTSDLIVRYFRSQKYSQQIYNKLCLNQDNHWSPYLIRIGTTLQ